MDKRKDTVNRSSRRSRGSGQRESGGFTVLEMMVTVVVLAMMITAFSTIILQCNRVVSRAQTLMRRNSKVAAIAHMLRRDIHRATKGGIMAITQSGTPPMPILFLTTGEPMTSTRTATECIGSYVVYSMMENETPVADEVYEKEWYHEEKQVVVGAGPTRILWRPEYGFPVSGRGIAPVDAVSTTLAEVQALSSDAAADEVSAILSRTGAFYYPPTDLSQIHNLWQVLCAGCSELAIMWTDGTATEGQMIWHDSSEGLEVWTSDDAGSWPKAILVRFRLTHRAGTPGQVYEIICELSP